MSECGRSASPRGSATRSGPVHPDAVVRVPVAPLLALAVTTISSGEESVVEASSGCLHDVLGVHEPCREVEEVVAGELLAVVDLEGLCGDFDALGNDSPEGEQSNDLVASGLLDLRHARRAVEGVERPAAHRVDHEPDLVLRELHVAAGRACCLDDGHLVRFSLNSLAWMKP